MSQKEEVDAQSLSRSPKKSVTPERKALGEIKLTPKSDPVPPYEKPERNPAPIPPSNPYAPPTQVVKQPRRQIPRMTSEIPQHEPRSQRSVNSENLPEESLDEDELRIRIHRTMKRKTTIRGATGQQGTKVSMEETEKLTRYHIPQLEELKKQQKERNRAKFMEERKQVNVYDDSSIQDFARDQIQQLKERVQREKEKKRMRERKKEERIHARNNKASLIHTLNVVGEKGGEKVVDTVEGKVVKPIHEKIVKPVSERVSEWFDPEYEYPRDRKRLPIETLFKKKTKRTQTPEADEEHLAQVPIRQHMDMTTSTDNFSCESKLHIPGTIPPIPHITNCDMNVDLEDPLCVGESSIIHDMHVKPHSDIPPYPQIPKKDFFAYNHRNNPELHFPRAPTAPINLHMAKLRKEDPLSHNVLPKPEILDVDHFYERYHQKVIFPKVPEYSTTPEQQYTYEHIEEKPCCSKKCCWIFIAVLAVVLGILCVIVGLKEDLDMKAASKEFIALQDQSSGRRGT